MVALAAVVAYFFGAIPVALMAGRLVAGIDIREHGSGNTGATNAFRVLGPVPGIVVMAADMLKGALGCLAMAMALMLLDGAMATPLAADAAAAASPWHDAPMALALLAAILGHMFSPFMRFKGGKGIAAGFGGLLVVMPLLALLVLAVFALFACASRIVSLGSIAAAVSLPIGCLLLYGGSLTFIILTVLVAFFVLLAHRKNIDRLLHGREPRMTLRRQRGMDAGAGTTPESGGAR
jgi:glycerol-3-phosphate acyltransferase PlsY